jgi:hypothetical protein
MAKAQPEDAKCDKSVSSPVFRQCLPTNMTEVAFSASAVTDGEFRLVGTREWST